MTPVLSARKQNWVKELVVEAGINITKRKASQVLTSKNTGYLSTNTVTQVDIDTENFLRERLCKYFPSFGFYSEESATESINELKKDFVWVVDPIDGTLNFSRRLPFYGISVGLLHQNQSVFGVIYLPEEKALYFAQKDRGAYLGRNKLRVAHRTDPHQLYAVLGHKGLTENLQGKLFSLFAKLALHTRGFGSTIYHLAHVASGQIDLMMAINLALWDITAGWIIVEEAGGKGLIVKEDRRNKNLGDPYHLWFISGNNHLVDWFAPKLRSL